MYSDGRGGVVGGHSCICMHRVVCKEDSDLWEANIADCYRSQASSTPCGLQTSPAI